MVHHGEVNGENAEPDHPELPIFHGVILGDALAVSGSALDRDDLRAAVFDEILVLVLHVFGHVGEGPRAAWACSSGRPFFEALCGGLGLLSPNTRATSCLIRGSALIFHAGCLLLQKIPLAA